MAHYQIQKKWNWSLDLSKKKKKTSESDFESEVQSVRITKTPDLVMKHTIDWLILLEAQQPKNAYLQGIPDTNIEGD